MAVPKGKRRLSRFEAQHHFFKLRDSVTELMINDFGFDLEKYHARIEQVRQRNAHSPNCDKIVERYVKRANSFNRWFIDKECDAVLEILRIIESEFTFGNSIYPSETPAKIDEFKERRKHIDAAIAECYVLKQELQYIIRTLPVDINKYARFAHDIDDQISLYKGVRQADNRLLKEKQKNK